MISLAELFDFFWEKTVQQHRRTRVKLRRVLRVAAIGQTKYLSFAIFMIQKRSVVLVDYNNNLSVKSTTFFAASVPVYKIIELKNSCPTFAF